MTPAHSHNANDAKTGGCGLSVNQSNETHPQLTLANSIESSASGT